MIREKEVSKVTKKKKDRAFSIFLVTQFGTVKRKKRKRERKGGMRTGNVVI